MRTETQHSLFRAIVLASLLNVAAVIAIYAPNHETHEAAAEHAQTDQVGPAVRSKKSPEERTADYTFWLTAETFVLAVSTVGLWVVTWRGAAGQARDMQESIFAAKRAADIAESGNRPWIKLLSVKPTEDLLLAADDFRIYVEIEVQNTGRSPATRVSHRVELFTDRTTATEAAFGYVSGGYDNTVDANFPSLGHVLFPRDTVAIRTGAFLARSEFESRVERLTAAFAPHNIAYAPENLALMVAVSYWTGGAVKHTVSVLRVVDSGRDDYAPFDFTRSTVSPESFALASMYSGNIAT